MNTEKENAFFIKIKNANPTLNFDKAIYVNRYSLLTATCCSHGDFLMKAGSFLRTVECPECNLEKRKQNFIDKANIVHNNKYDYSKIVYKTNKIPVEIVCPIHGSFMQAPGDHLKGYGCSKCSKKYKPTTEEWIEKAKIVSPDYDYSRVIYKDNKTPVEIICPLHGSFFPIPSNFIKNKSKCPKCNDIRKHDDFSSNTEEFIEKAKKVHGNAYDYSKVDYYNKVTKVCIICPEHGEFMLLPSSHLSGSGCSKCVNKNQTKLWKFLCTNFENEEILYEVGKDVIPWLGKLRFDIYFPKYNIAVEYDGELHFLAVKIYGGDEGLEKTLKRDYIKNKLCEEHKCHLFRIPYNRTEDDLNKLVENIRSIINSYALK